MKKPANDNVDFRPLEDRVVIKAAPADTVSQGGILIPGTAQGRPTEGLVVSVGPGKRDEKGNLWPLDVKPGDRIMFTKYTGTEINLKDGRLIIMKESDILGVFDKK